MTLEIKGFWYDKVLGLLKCYRGNWDLVKSLILQSPNHNGFQKAAMIGAGLQIICQQHSVL